MGSILRCHRILEVDAGSTWFELGRCRSEGSRAEKRAVEALILHRADTDTEDTEEERRGRYRWDTGRPAERYLVAVGAESDEVHSDREKGRHAVQVVEKSCSPSMHVSLKTGANTSD